jgi:hypothetical protein
MQKRLKSSSWWVPIPLLPEGNSLPQNLWRHLRLELQQISLHTSDLLIDFVDGFLPYEHDHRRSTKVMMWMLVVVGVS